MPLKRTPPSSPAITISTSEAVGPASAPPRELSLPFLQQNIQHCTSEPNLTQRSKSITLRKRKHVECNDDMYNNFMSEIKQLFNDFKEDQNRRIEKLCATVEQIRTSFEFLSDKYDSLLAKVDKFESERQADALYIQSLEEKLENAERGARSTCLEIRNIPKENSENKNSLLDVFLVTTKVLNIAVAPHEVKDIFRVKTKNPTTTNTVIVDLTSCLLKEKIIRNFRNFNKGPSKLNTEHLHIKGESKRIFISENLSTKMKKLFFLARDFANTNNFRFCWVSHGKIFMRKRENGALIRIQNEADFAKIKEDAK